MLVPFLYIYIWLLTSSSSADYVDLIEYLFSCSLLTAHTLASSQTHEFTSLLSLKSFTDSILWTAYKNFSNFSNNIKYLKPKTVTQPLFPLSFAHHIYSVSSPWSKVLQVKDCALCWAHSRTSLLKRKIMIINTSNGRWWWADWQTALNLVKGRKSQACLPAILTQAMLVKWPGIVQIHS